MRYNGDIFDAAYIPFPNLGYRNVLQARVEIPTLIRLLCLPRGGALLEVGCGRGVALGPLARALEPVSLAAVDIDPDLLRMRAPRFAQKACPRGSSRPTCEPCPSRTSLFDLVVPLPGRASVGKPH